MRARYYSPEMRRFVNADILPGGISEAITLNRYAYANGNPVSFVDPFGLKGMSNHHERVGDYFPNSSAEQIHLIDEQLNALAGLTQSTDANSKTQADSTLSLLADDIYGDGNFYQAVLVVRFKDEGLSLVGHTQLYFRSDKDKWYYTEYTTSGGRNVKEKMKNAQVYYRERIPPVFDPKSGTFINADGCDYVVLNGDFNESKALAEKYYIEQSFGKYDFFFHNCSDYTDEILDHAHIDGYYSQLMLDGDSLISVPALRVQEAKLWGNVDSSIECITPLIEEAKERIAEAAKEKMAEVANYVLDLLRP